MAIRSAKIGFEVCGLLVAKHSEIELIPVRNSARKMGSFEMWGHWQQISLRAANCSASRVVGSYHSHPWAGPEPGDSDIAGMTKKGSLMLIISVLPLECKLWRIEGTKITPQILIASHKPHNPRSCPHGQPGFLTSLLLFHP